MKNYKKYSGEELINLDEKGNAIGKDKEEKKNKFNFKYKIIIPIIFFILIIVCYYIFFHYKKNIKNVFDETTIKNLKLKNRVFLGPITHNIEKIEKIVKNNISLVVTDGAAVGDFSISYFQPEKPFRIDDDKYIKDIKELADVVHKYNSYILLDLFHPGLMTYEKPIYSPSADKSLINKNLKSKVMTKEDILRIEDYFVQAAKRAKKAGYDGIEIHGAHLTLVSLFSSIKYNRRTDEYGGNDENRSKFIVEIVKKIKQAVGDDMIISAKIDSVDEEYGFTENGFLTLGKALEKSGVDLIEVSGANPVRKDKGPYFFNDTKKLADILNIPIVCIGGIKSYEQADYILKNSNIEYVSLSRELLKDPDIIKKWYLNK